MGPLFARILAWLAANPFVINAVLRALGRYTVALAKGLDKLILRRITGLFKEKEYSLSLPMLNFKEGVKVTGNHFLPEIRRMLDVARATIPETNDGILWVASANDGEHGEGSKHYSDEAFDFQVANLKQGHPAARAWSARMSLSLGEGYDVVLEDGYLHAEYDPESVGDEHTR